MATCGTCNGSGRLKYKIIDPPEEREGPCPTCGGSGKVPDPPPKKK